MSVPSSSTAAAHEARVSLLAPIAAVVRRARLIMACVIVAVILGGFYGYWTREFLASSIMMPQSSESAASRFAGVAAQFGISVGGSSDGESLSFYAALLKSRRLLVDVARTEYAFPRFIGSPDTVRGTLVQLLGYEGETPEGTDRTAFIDLQDRVAVAVDYNSGLAQTTVRMPHPLLAEVVNRRMLELLNEFNVSRRQSSSRIEREFSEARLAEAVQSLREAEGAMQRFLDANRTYQGSPRLQFEQSRLQRAVDEQQSIVTALRQSVEQARLDEVRDVPVVTVVDPPEGGGRSSRNPFKFAIMMGFVGGVLAIGLILVLEYIDLERRERPEELTGLTGEFKAQIAWRPWRRTH